jgi:hypothetical protein
MQRGAWPRLLGRARAERSSDARRHRLVPKAVPQSKSLPNCTRKNAQIAGLTKRLRKVHKTGEHLSVETTLELARRFEGGFESASLTAMHAIAYERPP